MTTTLHLVRHGVHDSVGQRLCGREGGVTLSAAGKAQAERLARRFGGLGVVAVYATPLERTRETARPIAQAHGLPVRIADELQEIDFGRWTGVAFSDLEQDAAWRLWNEDRGRARPPGGEAMWEVQLRVARWLEKLPGEHPADHVVAVAHADVIKAALAWVMGLPLQFHQRIEISPGSVSVVLAEPGWMKVHSINEVPDD